MVQTAKEVITMPEKGLLYWSAAAFFIIWALLGAIDLISKVVD